LKVALALCLACSLAGIWLFRYLPLTDLPEYLLAAEALTAKAAGDTRYTEFFTIEFPTQPFGSSYFWFTSGLSFLLGAETATRIYLSIALAGTILGFALWLRAVEPSREIQALPATILLYGFFFQVGFLPFLFAMPFVFLALRVALDIPRAESSRRAGRLAVWLAILLLVVYFSHILAFAVVLLAMLGQVLLFTGRRRVWLLSLAALPSLWLLTWFLATEPPTGMPAFDWSSIFLLFHFTSVLLPFNLVFDPSLGIWRYHTETLLAWAMVVGVFAAAWWSGGRISRRLGAICLVLIVMWLLTPEFHVTYPLAFFLAAAAPLGWHRKPLSSAVVVLACLLAAGGQLGRMVGFQSEARDLHRVIESIPDAQRLQPVITDSESKWFASHAFFHAATWYNFRKGGTNPYTVAHLLHFPLKYRKQVFPKLPGEWHAADFDYAVHGRGTDYFLVRTSDRRIIDQLRSNVPLRAHSGSWLVFGPNPRP